jgi:Sulfotransferase family
LLLRGYVDQVTHHAVTGWAVDEESPASAVEVIVSVNGKPISGATGNRYREDLRHVCAAATAKYGFECPLSPSLSPFVDNSVEVTFQSTARPLDNGQRVLSGLRRSSQFAPKGPLPILVSAIGRSGTSHLMSKLAAHPKIGVAGKFPYEVKMLSYYSLAFRTLTLPGERERSTNPDDMASEENRFYIGFNPFNHPDFQSVLARPAVFREFFSRTVPERISDGFCALLHSFYELVGTATNKRKLKYFAEKTHPDITSRLAPRYMFGAAKEILLVRDPRDLLCSFSSFWRQPDAEAISSIAQTMCEMTSIYHERRDDVLMVKFEDLVLDESDTLSRISTFLELDTPFESGRAKDAAVFETHATVASPQAAIGRWRKDLSSAQIEECLSSFAVSLDAFGYDPA